MEFIKELTGYLFGNVSLAFSLASLVYVLLGASVHVLYDVQTRYKLNFNSPIPFDWGYFWKKNKWRFVLNITVAIIIAVCHPVLIGHQLAMIHLFLLGLCFDTMYVVIKKLKNRFTTILNKVIDTFKL